MSESAAAFPLVDYEFCDLPAVPAVQRLVAYWDVRRGERFAPTRGDIDPAALAPLLPDVMLVDVVDGGQDFRFRLIGTRIVEGLGRDSTGRKFSELYASQPTVRKQMVDRFEQVVRRKRPVFSRGRIYWMPDRGHKAFESAHLPLSADSANVDMILAMLMIRRAT